MNAVEKSIYIALKAHEGQVDKAGKTYILHPFTVALNQATEEGFIVGMLHDVVEDSEITIDDLKREGFSDKIIEAVQALTHGETEDYFDYIKRVKENELAIGVKLADLKHNSDLSRLPVVTEKDLQRVEKYKKSIDYLTS